MNTEREKKVRFWHLVNSYVTVCDGDPGRNVYGNTARQDIVAKIEAMVFPNRLKNTHETHQKATN